MIHKKYKNKKTGSEIETICIAEYTEGKKLPFKIVVFHHNDNINRAMPFKKFNKEFEAIIPEQTFFN